MSVNKLATKPSTAVERMQLAMRTLATWKAEGKAPRVQWEPIVCIVSAAGTPLQHPAGCLMECLWVLRDERPHREESVADIVNRKMRMAMSDPRGPDGVA